MAGIFILLAAIVSNVDLSVMQLIFRGILCDFIVCLAVYSGIRLKSETGKH